MPNRILKESICTSDEIDSLGSDVEVFFYRLMVVCDDFGLMDARPAILKARCYPLKSIDIKIIQSYLDCLHQAKLISVYEVDGKPYLHITTWEKHQQIRAKRSKFPTPNMGHEITCNQLQANVPVIQSNPIQSESNPNPIQSTEDFFSQAWNAYPKRPGASRRNALKAWEARIKAGVLPSALIDGVEKYARYCEAMQIEPKFIKSPETFFGPGEHYLSDWTPAQGSAHGKNGGGRGERISSVIAELTGRSGGSERVINGIAERVD